MTAFTPKRIFALVAALALCIGLGLALTQKPAAPDVTFTTLQGEKVALRDLSGKVVYVNFWATSCPGCIQEMPDLTALYRDYAPRGLEIIAVAMPYDPPQYVQTYQAQNRLPFPVVLDVQGEVTRAFNNVQVTPTAFLIGPDGKIAQEILGVPDFVRLRAWLDATLPRA